jgi:hypothetical protein
MPFLAIMVIVPIILGIVVCAVFDRLEATRFAVRGVVAPFFAAIALAFGLFGSLIVSEIWQKSSRITTSLTSEMSSLRGMLRIAEVLPEQPSPALEMVNRYVDHVRQWELESEASAGESRHGGSISTIQDLFTFAAEPVHFGGNAVLNQAFLDDLNKVREARFERLQVEQSHASGLKIVFLLILGLLTQIAIALCHSGQRRASWVTGMLFSVTFSATMAMVAMIDAPLSSRLVSLKPIADVH